MTAVTQSKKESKTNISMAEKIKEEEIINFNDLYTSMQKCKNGVLWKGSVASYYLNGVENTIRLQKQLLDGTYKARKPITFTITSPKRREILSVAFRDRVYQRALNDNWIYPRVTKGFIFDNVACQKGKGTDFALKRMREFLRKAYRKCGQDFYIAKCDIKGYYPNMRHDRVNNIFEARLPEGVFERSLKIMQQQYTSDIGYNPGSQMIQIAGIAALDEIDHYIKEVLHIRWYMRYMDDFILIHPDKEYLKECIQRVKQKLKSIGFELNAKKTAIMPARKGFMFLGFEYHISPSGRVYMIVDPKKIKDKRRHLRRMVAKSKRGELDRAIVDESYTDWKAHIKRGNSFKIIQKMDRYYESLWKDEV